MIAALLGMNPLESVAFAEPYDAVAPARDLASRTARLTQTMARGVFSVLEVDGHIFVFLGPADPSFSAGVPRLVSTSDAYIATRDVSAALPNVARAMRGTRVAMHTADTSCEATLDDLVIASLMMPDDGVASIYQGEDEDNDPSTPVVPTPPEQIAADIVGMVDAAVERGVDSADSYVVGIARVSCRGVLVATVPERDAVRGREVRGSRGVRAAVRAALLGGHDAEDVFDLVAQSILATRRVSYEVEPDAEDVAAWLSRRLRTTEYAFANRRVVVASVRFDRTCSNIDAFYVFERADGHLVRLGESIGGRVLALRDLTDDGVPELIFEDDLGARNAIVSIDARLTPVSTWRVYWDQCSC